MEGIRFILCIHNHQPVGNFDEVIEDAYQRAYLPFLEVMDRFPSIPWVLHNSGCLWEWLEVHHPEYIERVGRQVTEERLELLGGGFYEPVLPALTPEDRRGQLTRMSDFLEQRFGERPRGVWLTERVWEPDLPVDLVAAGIRFLPLDDTQLHQVGVGPERVRGPFETESAGSIVRIFPALMKLRYHIPFSDPEVALGFLRDPFPGGADGLAVYADDGEKFGIWPGTHRLVYEERWLERFLATLQAASDRIRPTTFSAETETRGEGLVYLPSGSYAEMGQWALPPEMQAAYTRARRILADGGGAQEAELFVRGGFWRGFFARYPESSWMHLRGLDASRRWHEVAASGVARAARARLAAARTHLDRAQCNCAYWHGIFGGLYLPHLRDGIYRELIRGERELAGVRHAEATWVESREADLDADGAAEIILENESLALFVDPGEGGRLVEWDDRDAAMNVVNVLARRPEFYHRDLQDGGEEGGAPNRAETIHGAVRAREGGLRELLLYDAAPRAAWVDRFFIEPPAAERLRCNAAEDVGDFSRGAYTHQLEQTRREMHLRLMRQGTLASPQGARALCVEKRVRLRAGQRGFSVHWSYRNPSKEPLEIWAGIENHINLLAGDGSDRYVLVDGKAPAEPQLRASEDVRCMRAVALVDGWRGWHIAFELSQPVRFCRYGVETVSLSEAGAERNYQGTAMLFCFPLALPPGRAFDIELAASLRQGLPKAVAPGPARSTAEA